jgi:hypothetical protein
MVSCVKVHNKPASYFAASKLVNSLGHLCDREDFANRLEFALGIVSDVV